jgi:hypothetical protein
MTFPGKFLRVGGIEVRVEDVGECPKPYQK